MPGGCICVCLSVCMWLSVSAAPDGIQNTHHKQFTEMDNGKYYVFLWILALQSEMAPLPSWSVKPKISFQDKNLHLLPKNSTFILFCQNLVVREWEVHALSARQQHRQRQASQQVLQVLQFCAQSPGEAEHSRSMWTSSVWTFIWYKGNEHSSPSSSFFPVLCTHEM